MIPKHGYLQNVGAVEGYGRSHSALDRRRVELMHTPGYPKA
jgi:hypothetical protein